MKLLWLFGLVFFTLILTAQTDREIWHTKEVRCRRAGIALMATGGACTIVSGGLLIAGGVQLSGPNFDTGINNLTFGVFVGLLSIPFWIAGPVKWVRAKHFRQLQENQSASLSFHPDIANTSAFGYHPSPTMGVRLCF